MLELEQAKSTCLTTCIWQSPEILEIFNRSFSSEDVLLDVGCHKGVWVDFVYQWTSPNKPTVIGIDPLNHGVASKYAHFFERAIDSVELNGQSYIEKDFNVYTESACNSLYPKNENCPVNKKYDWFNLIEVKKIKTTTLEYILSSLGYDKVFYIKCDCQGKDLDVVKSLGRYLDSVEYIQMESIFDDETLYTGQNFYVDDVREMKSLGFDPIYYCVQTPTDSNLPLEGELLFKRRSS